MLLFLFIHANLHHYHFSVSFISIYFAFFYFRLCSEGFYLSFFFPFRIFPWAAVIVAKKNTLAYFPFSNALYNSHCTKILFLSIPMPPLSLFLPLLHRYIHSCLSVQFSLLLFIVISLSIRSHEFYFLQGIFLELNFQISILNMLPHCCFHCSTSLQFSFFSLSSVFHLQQ